MSAASAVLSRAAGCPFRTCQAPGRLGMNARMPRPTGGAPPSPGSVAVAAGPDEGIADTAFGRDQRGEDRRREARIVELDREVFAACTRSLPPRCAQLDRTGE